ncbi:tetratricopeptide repeat protein [Sandaracinus amylolyticus]|uniref:tetratricopeptide repeat protein n=1 Tax=Sandaracinus amylolyticus TaxID=927083 RepID=UPI001F454A16|nr:tetratricopeptide repeat protein [Sandaracinus amylolyticus]
MPEVSRPVVLFDSWVRLTESTDSGLGRGAVFEGLRCVLVSGCPGHADELAQELRARGSLVVVCGRDGDGLTRATALDPQVVLLDETPDASSQDLWERLGREPALRGARPVRFRWAQLRRSASAPLDVEAIAMRIAPVMQTHHAFWRSAAAGHGFEAALDRIGSVGSLVRLLASGAGTLRGVIASVQGDAELVAIDGLVVAAKWTPQGEGAPLEGLPALAIALDLEHGIVAVDRLERPFEANVVLPVDEAIARARSVAVDGSELARPTPSLELRLALTEPPRTLRPSSRPPPRPSREHVAELLRGSGRGDEATREELPDDALRRQSAPPDDDEGEGGRKPRRIASGTRLRASRDEGPTLGGVEAQATRRMLVLVGDDDPTTPIASAARQALAARLVDEDATTPIASATRDALNAQIADDEETTTARARPLPAPVEEATTPDVPPESELLPEPPRPPPPSDDARTRRRAAIAIGITCVSAIATPAIVATGIVLATHTSSLPPPPVSETTAIIAPPERPAIVHPPARTEPRRAAARPATPPAVDPEVEARDTELDQDLAERRRRSDALVTAARRHLDDGDRDGAESRLLEAHRIAPFNPHPSFALARIYADEGRIDLARRWIDRAIDLRPRRTQYRAFRRALDRAD